MSLISVGLALYASGLLISISITCKNYNIIIYCNLGIPNLFIL
jgi:hypothetical protein